RRSSSLDCATHPSHRVLRAYRGTNGDHFGTRTGIRYAHRDQASLATLPLTSPLLSVQPVGDGIEACLRHRAKLGPGRELQKRSRTSPGWPGAIHKSSSDQSYDNRATDDG